MNKYILILSLMIVSTVSINSQGGKDTIYIEIRKNEIKEIPDSTNFVKLYPNPFSPSSTFGINVKEKSVIKIELYDRDWNYLFLIAENDFEPGRYSIHYDASPLKSGIYYFKLISGEIIDTQKTVLIK